MKTKINNYIGIGILTHNRYEVFKNTLEQIKKYSPEEAKIVVVDDASIEPVAEATFRFNENVGIATGKNKCLELLESCEHIFLFDDDTYPIIEDWYKPYINSPEPHLMYLFKDFKTRALNDAVSLYQDKKLKVLSHPRGCMLYFHNSVLKVAGGMDIGYSKWGFEHGDLSNRIYNLGMTSFRYADVIGSENLIHSGDEWQDVKTTVGFADRSVCLQKMADKYARSLYSKQFKPYKNYADYLPKQKKGRQVIITTYLNGIIDTQRNKIWEADYKALSSLINSTNKLGLELVILHNCFDEKDTKLVKHIKVEQGINPYFQRWLSIWQYLRDNKDIDSCFLVDGTDVEVLKNPFTEVDKEILYVGDEIEKLNCRWLMNCTPSTKLQEFFFNRRNEVLLNCGVIGGSRENVMNICRDIYDLYFKDTKETVDMPIFNFLMYMKYMDKVEHGRKVTTVFKANERKSEAWFKHK